MNRAGELDGGGEERAKGQCHAETVDFFFRGKAVDVHRHRKEKLAK